MRLSIAGAACLGALLAACGGGGGDPGGAAAPAAAPAAPARSTALADNPVPPGFGLATSRTLAGLSSSDFVPDPARFVDPGRTYVSIWQVGPTQERQQLALLTLRTLQALDARGGLGLQVPMHVRGIAYEVYDRHGAQTAISGEIVR
jgi:hypothetical protein